MPEDVPFDPGLSNYSNPQTLRVDVQDRSGADMLLILGGTVIFPETMRRPQVPQGTVPHA